MTKEEFLKEVRKEIHAIKIHATQEELNRLDFANLRHDHTKLCIYGQLSNSCFSERANEIFNKVFDLHNIGEVAFSKLQLQKSKLINRYNYTYLEIYLYYSNSNYHKHIIDFLQSKVKRLKTLKLKS